MGTSQKRGQTAPRAANQVRVLSGGRADGTERERTLCGDQDPRDQRHSVMSAKASSRVRASSAAPRTPRPSSASRVPLSTMTSASSSVRRRTFRWCLSECPSKAGKRSRSSGAATSSSQPCARHYTGTCARQCSALPDGERFDSAGVRLHWRARRPAWRRARQGVRGATLGTRGLTSASLPLLQPLSVPPCPPELPPRLLVMRTQMTVCAAPSPTTST
mmetsp:Transcript_12166/g.36249  ORF Transcript_12166/g.36249 Transcript_12166/m.36249 type:complete len:218 (+) Transcript_12166:197-850(+)